MIRTQARDWEAEGHVNGLWDDLLSSDDFEPGAFLLVLCCLSRGRGGGGLLTSPQGYYLVSLVFQFRKTQVVRSALDTAQGIREAAGRPGGGFGANS